MSDPQTDPHVIDLTVSTLLHGVGGFVAEGDVLAVQDAIASGAKPLLVNPRGWSLPAELTAACALDVADASSERLAVMDELVPIVAGLAFLRPPSLLVGLTLGPETSETEVLTLLTDTLAAAGLARSSVAAVVVDESAKNHPAVLSLDHPVVGMVHQTELEASPAESGPSRFELAVLDAGGSGANVAVAEREFRTAIICVIRRAATRPLNSVAVPTSRDASLQSGLR